MKKLHFIPAPKSIKLLNGATLASLILSSLLLLLSYTASAQFQFLTDGEALEKKGKYQDAIRKYILAVKDCKDAVTAMGKINALMDRIEKAERTAKQETEKTKKALAESEKQKAKNQKLVDAFYFAYDRFTLAFKDDKFYFIDKNGDKVEKLGEWDSAEQFDEYGFAKVNIDSKEHLLDTLGNAYPVSYNMDKTNPAITALDLRRLGLDSIIPAVFAHTSLKVLLLNINRLTTLPVQIRELKNLTRLDLGYNKFSTLPVQLWEMHNLTTLNLFKNQLDTLSTQIGELKNLTHLNLTRNQLISLPEQIGELKNLTYLYLGMNKLSTLPAQIRELKNLTDLGLGSNKFSNLPAQLWELKNLTSLSLFRNKLTSLSAQIGELKNLTYLDLSDNKLTTLPTQIGELKNLTFLELSNNQFSSLPVQIGELKNLKILALNVNLLSISEIKHISKSFQVLLFLHDETQKIYRIKGR